MKVYSHLLNCNYLSYNNNSNRKSQQHLTKVYSTLGSGIFVSLITFIVAQKLSIHPYIFIAIGVASIIGEIALLFMSKQNSSYQKLNFLSFYAYALSIGGGVGMIGYGLNQAQAMLFYKVVMSSFVMTTAVFGAFSVFSILTHQRIGIYLGSALLTLVLGIISIFVFNVMMEAVLGLIIGCLYVIVDTQTIIRRTEEGQFDVVRDAKMLFVDFVKIFIEILKILQENKKKDEEKDKKKK